MFITLLSSHHHLLWCKNTGKGEYQTPGFGAQSTDRMQNARNDNNRANFQEPQIKPHPHPSKE